MAIIRCENGHHYDSAKYTECPTCKKRSQKELDSAIGVAQNPPDIMQERDMGSSTDMISVEDEMPTYSLLRAKKQPVVGWLVCVNGPEKGVDFRLHAERNFVGSSPDMDICLYGDDRIQQNNHFSIVYEPNTNKFAFVPGNSDDVQVNACLAQNVIWLNDGDCITTGDFVFDLVCYCKDSKHW